MSVIIDNPRTATLENDICALLKRLIQEVEKTNQLLQSIKNVSGRSVS